VKDPSVIAVYAQTLSYTDGVSDPLAEILEVIEEENKQRKGLHPITLINDSCLAFSVLVHNDGVNGRPSMRLLDMTRDCVTPTIITIDAHKHLGCDKGISTIVGTEGTLAYLNGHVKVGSQPNKGELVRALCDMLLVGVDGYYDLYHGLTANIERVSEVIKEHHLNIIHANNRIKGSTVISVEDPSGVMMKRLTKLGHNFAFLYNVAPDNPEHCQTGWSLSLTPYSLRQCEGGRLALDIFLEDLVTVHKEIEAKPHPIHKLLPENSLPAVLLTGGLIDPYVFGLLWRNGWRRTLAETFIRRFFTFLVDSGSVCSLKRQDPLRDLIKRCTGGLVVLIAALVANRQKAIKA